jgi:flagellar hook-length control protein FliK
VLIISNSVPDPNIIENCDPNVQTDGLTGSFTQILELYCTLLSDTGMQDANIANEPSGTEAETVIKTSDIDDESETDPIMDILPEQDIVIPCMYKLLAGSELHEEKALSTDQDIPDNTEKTDHTLVMSYQIPQNIPTANTTETNRSNHVQVPSEIMKSEPFMAENTVIAGTSDMHIPDKKKSLSPAPTAATRTEPYMEENTVITDTARIDQPMDMKIPDEQKALSPASTEVAKTEPAMKENNEITVNDKFMAPAEETELKSTDAKIYIRKSEYVRNDRSSSEPADTLSSPDNEAVLRYNQQTDAAMHEKDTPSHVKERPDSPRPKTALIQEKGEEKLVSADIVYSKGGADRMDNIKEVPNQIEKNQLMSQIADKIDYAVRDGKSVIEISLTPDDFGAIEIETVISDKSIKLDIYTEKNSTNKLLCSKTSELNTLLTEKGFKVEQINISDKIAASANYLNGSGYESGHSNSNYNQFQHSRYISVLNTPSESDNESEPVMLPSNNGSINIYV